MGLVSGDYASAFNSQSGPRISIASDESVVLIDPGPVSGTKNKNACINSGHF